MILITGATGHFGQAAIDSLLKKGTDPTRIIVLARDAKKTENIKNKGINIRIGDYNDYPSLVAAFKGVDKLLFVSSSDVALRKLQHENVVKAAGEAGIKQIVYTSFERKNESESSPIYFIADSHLTTESLIKDSGINYTILRNNYYMDFIPFFIGEQVLETGTIFLPAGDGKAAVALRSEMAEAAAQVLISEGHMDKEYQLSNTQGYTYGAVAQNISVLTGKKIGYVSPHQEEYRENLQKAGIPEEAIAMLSGFALAQAEGEFDVHTNDLASLLGRKPTTLEDYLLSVYAPKQ